MIHLLRAKQPCPSKQLRKSCSILVPMQPAGRRPFFPFFPCYARAEGSGDTSANSLWVELSIIHGNLLLLGDFTSLFGQVSQQENGTRLAFEKRVSVGVTIACQYLSQRQDLLADDRSSTCT